MASSKTSQQAQSILDDETLAEEQLLDELENEEIPSYIREARLNELKQQTIQLREYKKQGYGELTELKDDRDFLNLTTTVDRCVVHFYHEDFRRCSILANHLKVLTEKYFQTKFAKIDVTKAHFLVEKLKVKVLPALFCFKKGIVVDKIVGFDDLGNTDSFQTVVLEKRLGLSGVIDFVDSDASQTKKSIFGHQKIDRTEDDESSDDGY